MKKLLSVVLALTLVLSLAACGGNKGEKITLYEDTWEGENVKLAVGIAEPLLTTMAFLPSAGLTARVCVRYIVWTTRTIRDILRPRTPLHYT